MGMTIAYYSWPIFLLGRGFGCGFPGVKAEFVVSKVNVRPVEKHKFGGVCLVMTLDALSYSDLEMTLSHQKR